ncbi:alpha/beta hydrolase [Solirubrobacter ginsenosidimutans]|uniref:Alpha/beta hydrolase n=1 Tax=Solirubrobacter ginsenosidimutans TaxID=490573 RepID=A0A9X3N046_9ACTN|nr:alpha/beta hydrolase [Solirubrobacter ginsenosidimutans]MDA0164377.1 alpha/beta hydrolase [Solirubrobacter ginsenosidimutans]
MRPQMEKVSTRKADGLEIRYAEWNAGAEPTLLLLNPWPETIYAWEQLWPRLSAAGHVLAIDLPGFGHSQARADLFSPQAMGRFLVGLIEEWELGAPHVFGPDVGAPTALFAAAESPSSLLSAVIGNGATSYPLEVDGTLKDLIDNPDFESLLALDGAEIVRQSMTMHETYTVSAAALEDYVTGYAGSRFGESARFVRNYPTDLALLEGLLPRIETPVKIIAGDHDPMVPLSNATYLTERLPHCELTVLDLGHFAWEDGAEAWGDAALAWLDGGYTRVGGDA